MEEQCNEAIRTGRCFAVGRLRHGPAQRPPGKKVIGYYMDASDDYYKAGFNVFKVLAGREGLGGPRRRRPGHRARAARRLPELHHPEGRRAGGGPELPPDQLRVPEAGARRRDPRLPPHPQPAQRARPRPGSPGSTGCTTASWPPQSAIKHKVKRVIMIEGKLGQGTAGGPDPGLPPGLQEGRQGHRQPARQRRREGRGRQGPSGRVLGLRRLVRRSGQEGDAGRHHQPRAPTASTAPTSRTTR